MQFIRYFCGNPEIPEELKNREVQRTALYKSTVALIRAYANIADEMEAAGYSEKETANIKRELNFYLKLREEIRKASGETLDLKTYEADMRHLIDNYIQADEPKTISPVSRKHVQVDVEYILPRRFPIRQKKIYSLASQAAFSDRLGGALGNVEQVSTCILVQFPQVGGVTVGDDQHVPRIDGLDVHKGTAHLVLVDDAGG